MKRALFLPAVVATMVATVALHQRGAGAGTDLAPDEFSIVSLAVGADGDGATIAIGTDRPIPDEGEPDADGRVFPSSVSVDLRDSLGHYYVAQADVFSDGALATSLCAEEPEDPTPCPAPDFPVDVTLSDDRMMLTFMIGPLPDATIDELEVRAAAFRFGADGMDFRNGFPEGGEAVRLGEESIAGGAGSDATDEQPAAEEPNPDDGDDGALDDGDADGETAADATGDDSSDSSESDEDTAAADTGGSDDSGGGSGALVAGGLVVAVAVIAGLVFAVRRRTPAG